MDTSNWTRDDVGDSSLQSGDWRAQLQAAARERMVNRIMVTVKRHLPFSGHEGLQELRKLSERFEDNIYNAATSRVCYFFFYLGSLYFAYQLFLVLKFIVYFNNKMLEILRFYLKYVYCAYKIEPIRGCFF